VTWGLAPNDLAAHALGAIAGYAAFRAVALLYCALRGQDGLGKGDAKLLAAAGAWVGLAALPRLVFGAASLGIMMTLIPWPDKSRVRGPTVIQAPYGAVPFGPALALMLFIVRLYS
jgi:leader peptidase (prepilin peptidase)/N-methyltransferase